MNHINTIKNLLTSANAAEQEVYFIGIGGIGMSALARYFLSKKIKVSGYDKTETPLTLKLVEEGAQIHYDENLDIIPKQAALVVYTPAIPSQHKELIYYINNEFPVVKRSDVLQAISESSFNICTAGTHGKTTISTMIAHVLTHSGFGCNAFLGGISSNYNTNFWISTNNVCVIEADEYDRSFLKLNPDIAIITAMDADHLDIYGDEGSMQDAFVEFGNKVKEGGLLLGKFGLKRLKEVNSTKKLTYSLQNDAADVFASNIKIDEGGYEFDVTCMGKNIQSVRLNVGGMHNVENAIVAIAVSTEVGIEEEKIKSAIADYKGVHRRFEYIIAPKPQIKGGHKLPILIDDYAHHPEELKALLNSARTLFPQRVLTVLFQPHLFSRTKDFAEGFAKSLSIADRVILLPIYPARELPMEGVTSSLILDKVELSDKQILDKDAVMNWMERHVNKLNKEFGEVIIVAGAGDIDALVHPIKQIIE